MDVLQRHQLITSCTQTDPLNYAFGNTSPLSFFIISSRLRQYGTASDWWLPASGCSPTAFEPCMSSLDGLNPSTELCGLLPNFPNSTEVTKLPFPSHSCCGSPILVMCFFFFFPLLNNSANRLALECSRAVCSLMREAACQLFYLSSHLTANPTSLTNHHGIAVEIQN